jgi:hypothetical protein
MKKKLKLAAVCILMVSLLIVLAVLLRATPFSRAVGCDWSMGRTDFTYTLREWLPKSETEIEAGRGFGCIGGNMITRVYLPLDLVGIGLFTSAALFYLSKKQK